ncbi:MAG: hypothetical protein Q8R10_16570 [Pseudomonas sp.]|uniref:hypothetical protein n=1 Tax=Pseudomonas sp. TaxID=306 RepID=UPI002736614E|nr:hypothetical protein [Pseudomonas sp.]MDP3848031.1 hypothetical protein [Pseudomonas sp.]
MRSANIIITASLGVLATLLAIYAAPSEGKDLARWAMTLGMFISAAVISYLYCVAFSTNKFNNTIPQVVSLMGYLLSLIMCTISGGSFGVIYHAMEVNSLNFNTAFDFVKTPMLIGYFSSAFLLLITFSYLYFKSKKTIPPEISTSV